MTTRKFGVDVSNNRRALGVINQKGGAQLYPCAVNKRTLPQYVFSNFSKSFIILSQILILYIHFADLYTIIWSLEQMETMRTVFQIKFIGQSQG